MKSKLTIFCAALLCHAGILSAADTIQVDCRQGDMTPLLQKALDRACAYKGKKVVVALQPGDYHLYRESGTRRLWHVSNTTSETENPDVTKHIGLCLEQAKNVTVDGRGARLVTHGEMTAFAVSQSADVIIKNLTLTAADPTVPEMTVLRQTDTAIDFRVHPSSRYRLEPAGMTFVGHGWHFKGGIAQTYDPGRDVTWRSGSPLHGITRAEELEPGVVRLSYAKKPEAREGWVFQMRHSIRNEVCGLIQNSRNVTISNVHFAFLGNFGIVAQMSENITYSHLRFAPEEGSGRTCAGFADFLQVSGCSGHVLVENSFFSGSHDDPINVHGTHLALKQVESDRQVLLEYRHPQTFGFQSFEKGDVIDLVNASTLMPFASNKVEKAEMVSPREIRLTLTRPIEKATLAAVGKVVVENVTRTPRVTIAGNTFKCTPTRGILLTTRRQSRIVGNTFIGMPMSAILVADDGQSWYESGMVRDLEISGNKFLNCQAPVVAVWPENGDSRECVHRNIRIKNNYFEQPQGPIVDAKMVDGITVSGNRCVYTEKTADEPVSLRGCRNAKVKNNEVSLIRPASRP